MTRDYEEITPGFILICSLIVMICLSPLIIVGVSGCSHSQNAHQEDDDRLQSMLGPLSDKYILEIKYVSYSDGWLKLYNPAIKKEFYYRMRENPFLLTKGEAWEVRVTSGLYGKELWFYRCLKPRIYEERKD